MQDKTIAGIFRLLNFMASFSRLQSQRDAAQHLLQGVIVAI